MLVVAAVVLVTVLLIVETFRLLLPGLWSAFSAGDEQALSEYLASPGAAAQLSDAVVPGRRAGAVARHSGHAGAAGGRAGLRPVDGLSDELLGLRRRQHERLPHCTAARAGHPPPCRRQPQGCEAAGQRAQQQGPLVLHNSAFITPGLPNGIIPYAAANAGMRPKQFLAAIFISLPFPTC